MDAAAQSLIDRLRRNPDDAEAFSGLRAHYHQRGDYASLANLLEGWAARARDRNAGANAFYEAADLAENYLYDQARAATLYRRALEFHPLHMEASQRLQGIYEQGGDHRRVVEVLEQRAQALAAGEADPRHIASTHQLLGVVWEKQIQRVDRAIMHYRKAFELDPSLVQAIYAAREIYRQAGNLKAAVSLFDLEINAETDGGRRVALLRELAHIKSAELQDIEGAVVTLKRASQQAPTDLAVMHDLATMLVKRSEQARDPAAAEPDRREAADLLFHMAQSVSPAHGVAYAEAALDATPDHDGSLELLERLVPEHEKQARLAPRWVAYLQRCPDTTYAGQIRRRLGAAYLEAGQVEDAIICFEPLLERGDASVAEQLVDLYRQLDRESDAIRALTVAVAGLPPAQRVARLREVIEILVRQGKKDEAATHASQILDVEPADPEALNLVRDDCIQKGAFETLRNYLLAAARVNTLPVDARKLHLREAANLSENELKDEHGAVSAFRAISTLDPSDADARESLVRLLEATERWDELAQVLDRDALASTEPEDRAAIYLKLARLHRDQRQNPLEAIEVYRSIRDIAPDESEARDELAEALITVGAYLEAIPLLREQIAETSGQRRGNLYNRLGAILEEQLGDDEGAFEAAAAALDENAHDEEAISRMERIDIQAERWDRLLETLSYRAEVSEPEAKAATILRMGILAEEKLSDLDRAAEYFAKVLDLTPTDAQTLDRLCSVYDRAERYRDLVVLLRERAQREQDPGIQAGLYRRIARTLAERVRNEDGAAEAYTEVLQAGEDEEALRYLLALATKRDDHAGISDYAGRLAPLLVSPEERRGVQLLRAQVLSTHLNDDLAAIAVLRESVETTEEDHRPTLTLLAELADRNGEHRTLVDVLERSLRATEDDGLRVPIARRLADLYETELDDPSRAIDALNAWADSDLGDPDPQRRLVTLYESRGEHEKLRSILDSLAGIVDSPEEASTLVRQAARLSVEKLSDPDGAWERLVGRADEGDADAEEALRALAREASMGPQLAELYVRRAKSTDSVDDQVRHWREAAGVFEEYLRDHNKALEALLRAFALDLGSEEMLDEVDRLAELAEAYPRLNQVYDAIVRKSESTPQKVRVLRRHAERLVSGEQDYSAALDRLLRACALSPEDDEVLARAEALAPKAGRADELLVVYERRKTAAETDEGRVQALLRAVALAEGTLKARERALGFLGQAVALAVRSPDLAPSIEDAVSSLDDNPGEKGSATLALIDLYQHLANRSSESDSEAAAKLLLRGASLLRTLKDEDRAYGLYEQAARTSPNAEILDGLEKQAEATGRLKRLDRLLENLIDEALDQNVAVALLHRRGTLLAEGLDDQEKAGEVYRQLLTLRPDDQEVAERLRATLRSQGKYQDLLVVLEKLVRRASAEQRVHLLKRIAQTWETDLQNKWEALDAWKKVLNAAPDDEDARNATERLGHSTRRLSADELSDLAESEAEGESLYEEDGDPAGLEDDELLTPADLSAEEDVLDPEGLEDLPSEPTRAVDPTELPSEPTRALDPSELPSELTSPGVREKRDSVGSISRPGMPAFTADFDDPTYDGPDVANEVFLDDVVSISPLPGAPVDEARSENEQLDSVGMTDDASPAIVDVPTPETSPPPMDGALAKASGAGFGAPQSGGGEVPEPDFFGAGSAGGNSSAESSPSGSTAEGSDFGSSPSGSTAEGSDFRSSPSGSTAEGSDFRSSLPNPFEASPFEASPFDQGPFDQSVSEPSPPPVPDLPERHTAQLRPEDLLADQAPRGSAPPSFRDSSYQRHAIPGAAHDNPFQDEDGTIDVGEDAFDRLDPFSVDEDTADEEPAPLYGGAAGHASSSGPSSAGRSADETGELSLADIEIEPVAPRADETGELSLDELEEVDGAEPIDMSGLDDSNPSLDIESLSDVGIVAIEDDDEGIVQIDSGSLEIFEEPGPRSSSPPPLPSGNKKSR
ncbi:MAG: hypothetical protein AAGF12_28165 [Myxococcota bacterium]